MRRVRVRAAGAQRMACRRSARRLILGTARERMPFPTSLKALSEQLDEALRTIEDESLPLGGASVRSTARRVSGIRVSGRDALVENRNAVVSPLAARRAIRLLNAPRTRCRRTYACPVTRAVAPQGCCSINEGCADTNDPSLATRGNVAPPHRDRRMRSAAAGDCRRPSSSNGRSAGRKRRARRSQPPSAPGYTPLARTKESGCEARGPLPDSACTPGAVMTTDLDTICHTDTEPRRNVPASVHQLAFTEYGYRYPQAEGCLRGRPPHPSRTRRGQRHRESLGGAGHADPGVSSEGLGRKITCTSRSAQAP